MGVDDADGLKVGVEDGGADEGHAALFQVGGDGVGEGRGGRAKFPDRSAAGPAPEIGGKAAEFPLNVPEDPRIAHGGFQLAAVADDGSVLLKGVQLGFVKGADRLQPEAVKRPAKGFPLVLHALP